MTKIVINSCYGGFGLSKAGVLRYLEIKNIPVWIVQSGMFNTEYYSLVPPKERIQNAEKEFYGWPIEKRQEYNRKWSEQTFYDRNIARDDPVLVQVVEELGKEANGEFAALAVVEIPDDVKWQIEEYDGNEWVAEQHRTWS